MATHDYVLANQSGSSFRSDLNNALAAIVSQNSNATEPATTYAYQYWIDTSATPALVKQRNAANDAWVTLAEVDGQILAADGINSKPSISFAADIDCGLRRNDADKISIVTGGTAAIVIDSSQNVGVGSTAPEGRLHVRADGNEVKNLLFLHNRNNGASVGSQIAFANSTVGFSDNRYSFIRAISTGSTETGNHIIFGTNPTGSSASERMRISSDGKVGIGTTPSTLLHIASDQGGSTGRIKFDCNVSSGYDTKIEATDTGLELTAESNSRSVAFNTGSSASERGRFDGSGNFCIATTDISPISNNALGLCVRQASGSINANMRSTNAPHGFRRNDNGDLFRFYRNSATQVGSISVTSSATAFNTSSDYRLKENIVDLDGAITRVKQLAPKRFNFIVNPDATVDGFLAHEAQAVVPEAVTGTHDGLEVWSEGEELPDGVSAGDNKLDDDGNTIPDYQAIDQSKLVPLLTAALQEAIAKIETLETKVAALEAAN